jgi:hydroxymethylpyrimidine/phosphomethylpyrimidine kinase
MCCGPCFSPLVFWKVNTKVMVSTSGSILLPQSAANAYLTHLALWTTILTPNLPEAIFLAKLAGKNFGEVVNLTMDKRLELANFLASKFKWVLLKGGHAAIERNGSKFVIDLLVNSEGTVKEFVSEYSQSRNTHGTGCTLACLFLYFRA